MRGCIFLLGCILFFTVTACHRTPSTFSPVPALSEGQKLHLRWMFERGEIPGPDDDFLESGLSLTEECQKFLYGLPAQSLYGFIDVPEDYDHPDGEKLKVFYYGQYREGSVPILFYNGGPGNPSWASYYGVSDQQSKDSSWLAQSFIFMDQRGTGCSSLYPKGTSPEVVARLSHYYSKQIVLDSEQLRKKLFQDRPWKVFGQSYGGLIAHRYVLMAPDSLVAVHSHANTLNSDPYQRFFFRIQAQNTVLKSYFKSYPDDEGRLQVMTGLLRSDLCLGDNNNRFCGRQILVGLNFLLGFNKWESMHRWIKALHEDLMSSSQVSSKIWIRYFQYLLGAYIKDSYGPTVVSRMEVMYDDDCERVTKDLKEMGQDLNTWLLHECLFSSVDESISNPQKALEWKQIEAGLTLISKDPMKLETLKSTLETHPRLAFYLYAGARDTFVPSANFDEAVKFLGPLVHYTVFAQSGHDGFLSEPEIIRNLMR